MRSPDTGQVSPPHTNATMRLQLSILIPNLYNDRKDTFYQVHEAKEGTGYGGRPTQCMKASTAVTRASIWPHLKCSQPAVNE